MKRINFLVILFLITLSSCYEDYVLDHAYDGIYFPYQISVRTFVVGEGMKIDVGASLAGVRTNNRDRSIEFEVDESLINSSTLALMQGGAGYIKKAVDKVSELKLLPRDYYSISNSNIITIKKGEHSGRVTIIPDSVNFLSDLACLNATYALPLRIINADADSIPPEKSYTIIGLKYENMLFGNYWHGGVTIEKDAQGNVIDTITYYTQIPSSNSLAWSLTTISPYSVATNGVSNKSGSNKQEFEIIIHNGDISISSLPGSTYTVQPDGESYYNQSKLLQNRKLFLNYKYQNNLGNWCYAKDTLTFRNRIRDGVNEWQDENPAHYD